MAAYGAAKASLFAWPGLRAAVINLDDASGALIGGCRSAPLDRLSARGAPTRVLRAGDRARRRGLHFQLAVRRGRIRSLAAARPLQRRQPAGGGRRAAARAGRRLRRVAACCRGCSRFPGA
jgi:hypothetical protein